MHIHLVPANLGAPDLDTSVAAQRAASEKRAANVRRDLLSSPETEVTEFTYAPVQGDEKNRRNTDTSPALVAARSFKQAATDDSSTRESLLSVWA